MLAWLTRWMDRQWLAADYRTNRSWIGFVCGLPLLLGVLVLDLLPSSLRTPTLLVGLSVTVALATWAFWRWFKGFGSSRHSTNMVEKHRKLMAAKRDG